MGERFADVGEGVTLCYETFGDPCAPPLVLVMGLATQMIAWHEDFCEQLADEGFHVIRFDNRDVGRSTRVHARPPGLLELATRRVRNPPYTLEDMARDTVGLLDALELDSAHVVGASMGGMIAQAVAAHHGDRVRSLTSIMSTTGNRWKGQPAARLMPLLIGKPPRTKEESVERSLTIFRAVGSPGFPRDEDVLRRHAELSWDRGPAGAGAGRQLGAILASGDRTTALSQITAPTLVIHGTKDRLVHPSGGRATAGAIAGARLLMIDGMGHDLPRGAWPQLVHAIAGHARHAERAGAIA